MSQLSLSQMDLTFDRNYELDWRSLDYPVTALPELDPAKTYRPRSYTWSIDRWLDQGPDGACVGFAFAHDQIARPQVHYVDYDDAFWIYKTAQTLDPWEGEAYSGTSVLAGAKVLQQERFYHGYTWALTAEEVAKGVAYLGPCVLGLNWYDGMFRPDQDNYIRPTGRLAGGHAILAVGVKIVYKRDTFWWGRNWRDVDYDRSYITLHNSWGRSWAKDGQARLSLTDLARLLVESGDACFPIRNYEREVRSAA